MSRSWWTKLILLVVVTLGAAAYVAPTVFNLDPQTTKFPFKQKINLGLVLSCGVYMVLGVDFRKVFGDVADRLADNLREDIDKEKLACSKPVVHKTGANGVLIDDPKVEVECSTPEAKNKLYQFVKK